MLTSSVTGVADFRKVALIGTSCTGKTTIASAFAGRDDVVVVPEAARQYFAAAGVVPAVDRYSVVVQGTIQEIAIRNEALAEARGVSRILCDRSVLDAVVYTKFGGDEAGAARLFGRVAASLAGYDRLVLLNPYDVPYRQDEIRVESAADRAAIHELFVAFLAEHAVPYILLSGSADTRIDHVADWLGVPQ
jgi:nicotinamide riboside kinase